MKKFLVSIVILLFVFGTVAGVSVAQTASKPQQGGVLKIIYKKGPSVLGFPPQIEAAGMYILQPCIETLFRFDDMGRPTPSLATGYTIAPDKKSVTINLRKGVKFHDGTDFNAEAMKWNLEQFKEAKRFQLATVTSIDIVDEYSIRLNLTQYSNTLLIDLAFTTGLVASPTAIKKNGKDWAIINPVGTGPFKFKRWERDAFIEFERFNDYWDKGKPYLDGITFRFIEDPMTAKASFQAGEAHLFIDSGAVTPKIASDLKAMGYKVDTVISVANSIAGDSTNPTSFFADKRVREAVEYAIDRKTIVQTLGYGYWEALDQLAPKNNMGFNPAIQPRSYNPQKAKQLLAEAGYPSGFKTKILTTTQYASRESMSAIQGFLGEVGIQAEIDFADPGRWNGYKSGGWEKALMFMLFGTEPNWTQDLNRQVMVPAASYVSVARPAVWGDLMNRALAATDFTNHQALAREQSKVLFDEAMTVPLWATPFFAAKQKNLNDDEQCKVHWMVWAPANAWLSK